VLELPRLKAAVETDDAPTVQPLADVYRVEINADVLILAGARGQMLGAAGADATAMAAAGVLASSAAEISAFWPNSRGVLQVVSVPILIQPAEILGRLTVGFFLDDRLARQFKDLTGSDIAFGARGQVLASTLPPTARPTLERLMATPNVSSAVIDGEEFIALRRPLPAAADVTSGILANDTSPVAVILRSRTERLHFLNTIRTGLIGVLVVTVLLATIVSYLVARTVTRPLAAITHGMREVATTGDLTHKVTLQSQSWDDEDARLLASTFNTLTESIARFQSEASQRDRLSSLGRLSTVIAHEIRNPLMIIKASLRVLRAPTVGAARRREAVADIDEETTRLNRIVTEVLDFARPISFEYSDVSLNSVCATSAAAASAGEAEPAIILDLDPVDPWVITDPERLRTALVNVLTNARNAVAAKALTQSGVAVLPDASIRLTTRRTSASTLLVSVTDLGTGIAPADVERVFEPYFTTRRTGTGLGLPIAKNIVDGLGGTIRISSQPGESTSIDIELPIGPRQTS